MLLLLRLRNLNKGLIILVAIRFFHLLVKFVLKGKLLHATEENSELKQEVAYVSSCLERTIVSEKMTVEDLSRVAESTAKSTYKLGVSFERCEDKSERSVPKFVPSSNYHQEEEALKPIKTH
jgi:hypothetical protein